MSISVAQKKRGRPATGKTPIIGLRLPPELIARVDEWCAGREDCTSRSDAIRKLVEMALAAEPGSSTTPRPSSPPAETIQPRPAPRPRRR
jgi:hypothetical protein